MQVDSGLNGFSFPPDDPCWAYIATIRNVPSSFCMVIKFCLIALLGNVRSSLHHWVLSLSHLLNLSFLASYFWLSLTYCNTLRGLGLWGHCFYIGKVLNANALCFKLILGCCHHSLRLSLGRHRTHKRHCLIASILGNSLNLWAFFWNVRQNLNATFWCFNAFGLASQTAVAHWLKWLGFLLSGGIRPNFELSRFRNWFR